MSCLPRPASTSQPFIALAFALSFALGGNASAQAPVPAEYVHDCGLVHPDTVHAMVPVPPKPFELPLQPDERPRVMRKAPGGVGPKHFGSPSARLRQGALTGKTVYLSAGHGFYWSPTFASGSADNRWRTQRPNTFNVVEDLVSTETVNQFLVPLLQNAGAYVVTVRENDLNTRMAIVDDGSADYAESGPGALFSSSPRTGFGPLPDPLPSGTNPFSLGTERLMEAGAGVPAASATWTFEVPEDGSYNVYVSYSAAPDRVPDAHYVVRHAGGQAHFRVNQRRHGSTWVQLGRFYFRKGKDGARGAVVALNDSEANGTVALDAVRIGGGMGMIARPRSNGAEGPKSGRPRFEEASRYHTQFMGAPTQVYASSTSDRNDDVTARSRFTAWDHEPGDDGVFVAWHTNACGSDTCNARGTETYVYGPNAPPSPVGQFSGVAGSVELAQAVHGEIVRDLRGVWDPRSNASTPWNDRGIFSAYFGELNPNLNAETPAILLEMAFHNNAADAEVLKDPYFRYVAARAIAQGIIKYYAQRDGTTVVLPPEPPEAVVARNLGDGRVRVSWRPGATDGQDHAGGAADSFILYGSLDGRAWDEGLMVTGTFFELPLQDGEARYFRVTGVNAGGESFPSEIAGARAPSVGGLSPVLIVNGYERSDASLTRTENLSAYALASPVRAFIERMNDASYVRFHGAALEVLDVGFDSAGGDALAEGRVSLEGYALVDFLAGRGASGTVQLSAAHRDALRTFVNSGGRLLLSGSHVADGLANGSAEDRQFLLEILRAQKGPGGADQMVNGLDGEALEGLFNTALDDGTKEAYPLGAADVLVPQMGRALARWGTGNAVAAVLGEGTHRVAFLAFPFETVTGEARRTELMARLLTALEVPMGMEPPPFDGGMMPVPVPDAGSGEDAGVSTDPFTIPLYIGSYAEPEGCGCGMGGGAGMLVFGLLALLGIARRRAS